MHVQRGWKFDEGRRSLSGAPLRAAPLLVLLALTMAAGVAAVVFAVVAADRGWLPTEATLDAFFP